MKISKFDFDTNWDLVEPHLNDKHILSCLDEGMNRWCDNGMSYSSLGKWNRDIGPWKYTTMDGHAEAIFQKFVNDPEYDMIETKYTTKLLEMGVNINDDDLIDDVFLSLKDSNFQKLKNCYNNEMNLLYKKHEHKPNSYKWYQLTGGCFYLADWQEALAENIFPDYIWFTHQYHKKNPTKFDAGHSTTVGIDPKGDLLVFDILLFEKESVDSILKLVNLDRSKLEKIITSMMFEPLITAIDMQTKYLSKQIADLSQKINEYAKSEQ